MDSISRKEDGIHIVLSFCLRLFGIKGLVENVFMQILKRITDPQLRGADCKSAPAALNKMNIYPEEHRSNEPVIGALFSSFSDAPGGLKEELQEVAISTGMEYLYNRRFALRAGYFNESKHKGNRKFFTAGAGVKMNLCSLDFAYLMSTSQNNTLANTIRFTIIFDADSFKKTNKL